jgi:outer membrane protein TolC
MGLNWSLKQRGYFPGRSPRITIYVHALAGAVICGLLAGCRSPADARKKTDARAYANVDAAQREALGHSAPFSVEPPSEQLRRHLMLEQSLPYADPASLGSDDVERIPQWPEPAAVVDEAPLPVSLTLTLTEPSLIDSLQIAARSSREYQDQKEEVFRSALQLDLQRDAFRNTWTGQLEALAATEGGGVERVSAAEGGVSPGISRRLKSGGSFALDLGLDLVKLLTQDRDSAYGLLADATATLPLLRGAGRFVVAEPLTQAEREVVYAIYGFERFRRTFAVQVATEYLEVLQALDQVDNSRESYERLVLSTRRARRLADAGRLPEIQVDQVQQDELRARNRWISAQVDYQDRLDAFKVRLGLPTDAKVKLDRGDMSSLVDRAEPLIERAREQVAPTEAEAPAAQDPVVLRAPSREDGGPLELDEAEAIGMALNHRLDLRARIGRVFDTQRAAAVAADRLRADLALLGRGTTGQSRDRTTAGLGDADVSAGDGSYSATVLLDLPLERTQEEIDYRGRLIDFEKSVRVVQALEDQVKLEVRNELRALTANREGVIIQATSVEVAQRRLDSTTMFLEAGRVEIRDVLEAEDSMLSSQNALSAALVRYRVRELELQRDMGVLEIDELGRWKEYEPPQTEAETP